MAKKPKNGKILAAGNGASFVSANAKMVQKMPKPIGMISSIGDVRSFCSAKDASVSKRRV